MGGGGDCAVSIQAAFVLLGLVYGLESKRCAAATAAADEDDVCYFCDADMAVDVSCAVVHICLLFIVVLPLTKWWCSGRNHGLHVSISDFVNES